MKIRKAVVSTAGFGTRFLPETKSVSKEMLPIVDKPIIQYIVEELVASGIEDIIFVVRGNNVNLGNHFDGHFELENYLERNKKFEKLEEVKRISQLANYIYIRQNPTLPYGNGTPLLCVKDLLKEGEYFAYVFADDLVISEKPAMLQMMERFPDVKAPLLATQNVPASEAHKYGIVELKNAKTNQIERLIEKPTREQSQSTLAAYGRYILSTDIIDILEKGNLGKDGELWVADAINSYAQEHAVYNVTIDGEWLTTGDPLNYLKAVIKYGLLRDDVKEGLRDFLKEMV